jgi:hypothetical protein
MHHYWHIYNEFTSLSSRDPAVYSKQLSHPLFILKKIHGSVGRFLSSPWDCRRFEIHWLWTVEMRGVSGGQRKRVNVGLEMVMEPRLVWTAHPPCSCSVPFAAKLWKA